jgi:phage-related minor tail protein
MAGGIKGITIEIGGDTTKLGQAIGDAEKKSRSLQVELRQVEKLLKFDPTNVELLSQKQELLTQNVEETSKKLDLLKEAERQVTEQFKKGEASEEQVRALQREIIKTENVLGSMKSELTSTEKALKNLADGTDNAEKHTKEYAESVEKAKQELDEFKGKASDAFNTLKTGAIAAGAAVVATAGYALKLSTDFDKASNILITKTGAAEDEIDSLNTAMENVYANNFGESIEDVANAMATVKTNTKLAGEELQNVTEYALLLRDTFEFEVNESTRSAKMLMDQYGISAKEAYNLIAQGAQNGLDKNGDLLDTINEYAVHFNSLGIDAEGMFNMLVNGAENGTFSVDKLGDAVKEFGIRVKDGSTSTRDAFAALGYGASASQKDIDGVQKKIEALKSKLAEATEKQAELNQKASDLSKTNVEKHEQKISSLNDTLETLKKQLTYAKLEQAGFNEKTSQLTRLKNSDKIAEYTQKIKEAEAELKKLTSGQNDFTDSSTELAKVQNAEKIAQYKEEIEALTAELSEMDASTVATTGSVLDLENRFAAGGESAKQATQEIIEKLRGVENDVERNSLGVALFGTMWEDLGEDAIYALLSTQGEISATSDALDKINETRYDDIGSALQGLRRTLETDIIQPLGEELKPVVEDAIDTVKANAPQIKEILATVVKKIGEFVGFIVNNGDVIVSIIGAIGVGFLTWKVASMITGVVNAIKAFKLANEGATIAQWALNVAMNANPIGLIITAIAALVTAFILLWNNCEGFRNFFINLWEGIKNVVGNVVNAITGFFGGLWDGIQNIFGNIGGWFRDKFSEAKENAKNAWSNAKEVFTNVKNKVQSAFSNIGGWFKDKFKQGFDNAKTSWSTAKTVFSNVWGKVKEGFANVGGWFKEKFTEGRNNAQNAWSNAKQWSSNAWSNIKGGFSNVGGWFGDQFRQGWNNITNVFSKVGDFFGGVWNTIKSIFSKVGSTIADAVGGTVKKAINAVLSMAIKIINGFISAINLAISAINLIPGVNIKKLNKLEVPQMARGGIVKRPTLAQIGEDGAEAVIPLENNTEWLDKVAQRLERNNPTANNVEMLTALDRIYDRLNRLQVVLNNGVLVGEILDDIDAGLADKQLLNARGA